MGTPGKERQKKYIERQRQLGKLTVTLLLTKTAKEIIDRQHNKTQETFSDIVEKALLCYDEALTPKTLPPPPAPTPPVLPKPSHAKPAAAKKVTTTATGDKSTAKSKKKKRPDNQSSFEF